MSHSFELRDGLDSVISPSSELELIHLHNTTARDSSSSSGTPSTFSQTTSDTLLESNTAVSATNSSFITVSSTTSLGNFSASSFIPTFSTRRIVEPIVTTSWTEVLQVTTSSEALVPSSSSIGDADTTQTTWWTTETISATLSAIAPSSPSIIVPRVSSASVNSVPSTVLATVPITFTAIVSVPPSSNPSSDSDTVNHVSKRDMVVAATVGPILCIGLFVLVAIILRWRQHRKNSRFSSLEYSQGISGNSRDRFINDGTLTEPELPVNDTVMSQSGLSSQVDLRWSHQSRIYRNQHSVSYAGEARDENHMSIYPDPLGPITTQPYHLGDQDHPTSCTQDVILVQDAMTSCRNRAEDGGVSLAGGPAGSTEPSSCRRASISLVSDSKSQTSTLPPAYDSVDPAAQR